MSSSTRDNDFQRNVDCNYCIYKHVLSLHLFGNFQILQCIPSRNGPKCTIHSIKIECIFYLFSVYFQSLWPGSDIAGMHLNMCQYYTIQGCDVLDFSGHISLRVHFLSISTINLHKLALLTEIDNNVEPNDICLVFISRRL